MHSHYRRRLSDTTCAGRQVQLCLTVRRFYCRNRLCERRIFTERLPRFVQPWARMTIRLSEHLQVVGLATSGRGGVKLATRLGMQSTRQTLLRRIMTLADLPEESVLYLGIDDFSLLRGQRFGTVLVNLETHTIVDLLASPPERNRRSLDEATPRHRSGQSRSRSSVCQSRSGWGAASHQCGRPFPYSPKPDGRAPTAHRAES